MRAVRCQSLRITSGGETFGSELCALPWLQELRAGRHAALTLLG